MQSVASVGAVTLLSLAVLTVIAVMIHFAVQSTREWKQMLADIASKHRLTYSGGSWLSRPKATGMVIPAHLTVDTVTESSGNSTVTYYRVLATLSLPPLSLGREGFGSFFGKMIKGEDLEIGDPHFDDQVVIRGAEPIARALLDQVTRDAVLRGVQEGITVGDGKIEWRKSGAREQVPAIVDLVLELVARLTRPANAKALAAVARNDLPAVARGALLVMPPGEVRDALDRELLEKGGPDLRLIAARRLGGVAAPAVAELVVDARVPDALRAEGLQWLQRHADATGAARRCLDRPEVASIALAILASVEPAIDLPELRRLTILGDPTLTQQALRHARRHGAAAEPLLVEHLASDSAQTARVAAEALAEVGTVSAVMPLRARIERLGLFDGALKSAALAAIEAIQGRVGQAAGALTVVEGDDGRLSEA